MKHVGVDAVTLAWNSDLLFIFFLFSNISQRLSLIFTKHLFYVCVCASKP